MEESEQTQETESKSGMPTKLIGLIIGIVVLGAGGYLFLQGKNSVQEPKQEAVMQTEQTENKSQQESVATESAMKEAKTFAVEGSPFMFSVKEIKVKKGDMVKIVFTNKAGFHDWTIDEFNAKTKQLKAGETEEITFVASKSGTFEYYCSVGTHKQQGMVGKLIVE